MSDTNNAIGYVTGLLTAILFTLAFIAGTIREIRDHTKRIRTLMETKQPDETRNT